MKVSSSQSEVLDQKWVERPSGSGVFASGGEVEVPACLVCE